MSDCTLFVIDRVQLFGSAPASEVWGRDPPLAELPSAREAKPRWPAEPHLILA